jgi:hypothetical protein
MGFAAMHESIVDTKRTLIRQWSMSVIGGKANLDRSPTDVALRPEADIGMVQTPWLNGVNLDSISYLTAIKGQVT